MTAVEERLVEALDLAGNTHTLADVAAMIRAGRAQWWGNDRAGIVTEIVAYPRARSLRYWLVAGELPAVLGLAPGIEAWARGEGCTRAEAIGRHGWRRVLAGEGWRPTCTVLTKELET